MTLVDLLLVIAVGVAAWTGWRVGLTGYAIGLVGFVGGSVVGSRVAAHWFTKPTGPVTHLLLEIGSIVVFALLGAAAGRWVGGRLGRGLRAASLGFPDRMLGGVTRGALALIACWLLAAPLAAYAPPAVASSVDNSHVLHAVSTVLPAPRQVLTDVTRQLRVPADLAGLVPTAYSAEDAPTSAQRQAVGGRAASSVVSVHTTGTVQLAEGSGFVVGGGLVVTNWHVITRASGITVTDGGGVHPASVAAADVDADIAVLRADGLAAPALTLAADVVANGSPAVVMGYPGDGPLRIGAAVVLQRFPVVQSAAATSLARARDVYRIHAIVRPGNSGGPLLDMSGHVIGIVNAQSLAVDDEGYALTLGPLRSLLAGSSSSTR